MEADICNRLRLLSLVTIITLMLVCNISFADSKLDRCLVYKDKITSILERENVSHNYFYLAVCESGCRVKESPKGARGVFQVMPTTFRNYMDEECTDIDDFECNTIAAARYIKHLEERFKELPIIIKAYNRGGTNLIRKGTTKEADNLSACVMRYINNNKETSYESVCSNERERSDIR